MTKHRSTLLLFLLVALLLAAIAAPAFAQDTVIATNTPADAAVVPVDLEAVATDDVTAAGPVVINIGQQPGGTTATEPETPPASSPLINIDGQTMITILLGIVVLVNQYTNGGVIKVLASVLKISDERAKQLYDDGVRAGLQQQLNEAARTPDPNDDLRAAKTARDAGYQVVTLADGSKTLVQIIATESPTQRALFQEAGGA